MSNNKEYVAIKIGEGILDLETKCLAQERRKIIEDICKNIESIKMMNYKNDDKPNNYISILGERGSGKSSVMLTVQDKLEKKIYVVQKMKS